MTTLLQKRVALGLTKYQVAKRLKVSFWDIRAAEQGKQVDHRLVLLMEAFYAKLSEALKSDNLF